MIGIIIGVGSAYTCVPLLEALAIRKVLVEAGGELAELMASKAKEAAEGEPAAKPRRRSLRMRWSSSSRRS